MIREIKKKLNRLFIKSYKYYSHSHYYRKNNSLYDNIDKLCLLFDIKRESIETDKNIYLNTNIKFGSTVKQIRKKLGKPCYYYKKEINSLKFRVLYYKMYLGGYKTKQEIHFYNKKLFYFNYIFSYLNDDDKRIIQEILCQKYLTSNSNLKNKVIHTKLGNSIFIDDNVEFTINYLSGDPNIIKKFGSIKKSMVTEKKKEKEKHINELITKL